MCSSDLKVVAGVRNNWKRRQDAQRALRERIADWAGKWKYGHGETDSEIYRRFYTVFGVDVMSAQTLGTADAEKLRMKIEEVL